jgi:hypothetical protein
MVLRDSPVIVAGMLIAFIMGMLFLGLVTIKP